MRPAQGPVSPSGRGIVIQHFLAFSFINPLHSQNNPTQWELLSSPHFTDEGTKALRLRKGQC